MKKDNKSQATIPHRQKAEESLIRKMSKAALQLSMDKAMRLVHELEVYKIELELQNEELNKATSAEHSTSEKYTELYDFAPIGFFTLSKEGGIIEMNISGSQMLGDKRVQLRNKRFVTFVSDDTKPIFNNFLETVYTSKAKEFCEVILSTQGNQRMFVHITGAVIQNRGQCHLNVVDITERKQAEKELRESEELYRVLTEQSPIAIELYNPEGLLVSANPACLELFGIEDSNEIKQFSLFSDPNLSDENKNDLRLGKNISYQMLFDFDKVKKWNLYHTSKSGQIWLDIIITRTNDDRKEPTGYLVQIQDITKRKQAEENQRQAYNFLDSIIENIPNMVFIKEANDLRFVRFNQAGADLLGTSKEEMIGKNDHDFFTREQADFFTEKDREVMRSKETKDIPEEPIQTKHQGTRILHTRKVPILNSMGEPEYLLGISEDITESILVRESLRESEEQYHALYTESRDAIMIVTSEQKFISGNPSTVKMFGCRDELDFMAHSIADYSPEFQSDLQSSLTKSKEMMQIAFEKGLNFFEWTHQRLDGTEFPASVLLSVIEIGGKKVLQATVRDITLNKSYEAKLMENEQRFRSVTESANDAIVSVNSEGEIWGWNNSAVRMFGYSKEEIIGKDLSVIMPKRLVELKNDMIQRIQQGEYQSVVGHSFELFGLRKNEVEFPMELSISTWETGSGKFMTGTIRDITDRKQAEQELIKAKENAEESNRLKTAFLQNISHEIRTPMNAIIGFSRMLIKPDVSEEKLKSFLNIIIQSAEQLLSIVTDIITISALETNQEKINIQKVCINDIITNLLVIFKTQALNRNVSPIAKLPLTDKQSEIETDKTKVTQILTKLLNNALKFTPEGIIEFGYSLKGKELEFYVKDSGIGIAAEMQQIIFNRFRQASLSISQNYGGNGLGLAISKGFVELLGGKIRVESELGKGSAFYFTIPYIT